MVHKYQVDVQQVHFMHFLLKLITLYERYYFFDLRKSAIS